MSPENIKVSKHLLREIIIGWLISLIFFGIYLALPNINAYNGDVTGWTGELTDFAAYDGNLFFPTEPRPFSLRSEQFYEEATQRLGKLVVEAGWWIIWNPHHILFVPTNAVIFRLVKNVLPDLDSWTFLRFMNGMASAGTLLLLYILILRIFPRSPYAVPWTLFLGASVTFFRYATDCSQYPIPMLILAVTAGSIWAFASTGNGKYLIRTGLWLAIGILFHQIIFLMAIFILIAVFILVRGKFRDSGKVLRKDCYWMTGLALGIPVIFYLLLVGSALHSVGELSAGNIFKYITLYAQGDKYWTGRGIRGFITNLTTFVGFFFDNNRTQYLLFGNPFFTAILAILVAFWVTALLNIKKLDYLRRWWLYLCLLWIAPLLVFLSFWVPGHEFYHLFLTVPLSFMAITGAESGRRKGKEGWGDIAVFWIWCVAAIVVNFKEAIIGSRLGQ
jgi:hypothetical protein